MKVQALIDMLMAMNHEAEVHAVYVEDTEDGATAVDVHVIDGIEYVVNMENGDRRPQVELVLSFDGDTPMTHMLVPFPDMDEDEDEDEDEDQN